MKLLELISIFPFEPLRNCDDSPKKNFGVLISIELPLNVVEPFDCKIILLLVEFICVSVTSNPPIDVIQI